MREKRGTRGPAHQRSCDLDAPASETERGGRLQPARPAVPTSHQRPGGARGRAYPNLNETRRSWSVGPAPARRSKANREEGNEA